MIQKRNRWQRLGLLVVVTAVFTALFLFVLQSNARALRFINGAFGCGSFAQSVADAVEGKTIIPMVPARDSGGAVITKNIVIQGGWTYEPGGGNCAGLDANPVVTGTVGLRNAGFTFLAPDTRSELFHDTTSAISLTTEIDQLAIEHMSFSNQSPFPALGGAIGGALGGAADVRLTNVQISNTRATSNGGGLYLEVRGGSHLLIEDGDFSNNQSGAGGAFEIHVYDNSHVVISNTLFANNTAVSGNGGAGRIIMHSGYVTITGSSFNGNSAASGSGGAISVEGSGGSGEVWLLGNSYSGNSAGSSANVAQSGSGVTVYNLDHSTYLPLALNAYPPTTHRAAITGITLNSNYDYVVTFTTYNYTPALPGEHVHFFFNTVPASQAGVPGAGPWKVYGGSSPFTGYNDTDKPPFATHLCILVANPNHSVQANSGNCYRLPVNQPAP